MIKVILGPPGTGKTTTLINICKEALLDGTDRSRMGYLTFTRKAAGEAIHRATHDFGTSRDLPYFRTIHSLAFWSLRLSKQQVFSNQHLGSFARKHGYEFTTKNSFAEDGTFIGRTLDDKAFFLINLARNKTLNLETLQPELRDLDTDISYVSNMNDKYHKFKQEYKLIDFTDMLYQYYQLPLDKIPELDLLCIDEAQDLSTLQWLCVQRLIHRAKQVYIAGDDDQAIYEWSGANVQMFIEYAKTYQTRVLDFSYRFGHDIHLCGQLIIEKCKQRLKKQYGHKGFVDTIYRVSTGLFSIVGTTYYLARSFYLLKEIIDIAEDENWSWSYTTDKKNTPIKVGTIHSVKGGEADNVVLLTDVPQATFEQIDSDAEHRVWYTAVTRTRKNLYIVEPRTQYYYDI